MFIRSRKNVSGSTSIFIVNSYRVPGKVYSKSVMVKNFGSSKDPLKIESMIREAELYKSKLDQAVNFTPKSLNISNSADLDSCTDIS